MSAAEEQPVVGTDETKPVEPSATETPAVETTPAEQPAAEITPEMAVLAKDPEVVKSDLEKAEPVAAEPSAPEAAATTEDTPVEPTPPTGEKHKEGSTIFGFIKKHVPNPKAKPATSEIEPIPAATAPAAGAAPAATEPVDDKSFEGDYVEFKTHGGFFGGGWKRRELNFGKEDGYGQTALLPYIATHKVTTLVSAEKANACWDTAAHATVTGVGLLFVVKSKAIDIPLNIINLADVTGVSTQNTHFTIKTELMGDYEFTCSSAEKAQKWKTVIETRVEQAKLTRSGVQEGEKYKENFAYFKEGKAAAQAKATEAVTSDEEAGAVSGEESKRPGKWSRRISGSFQKITGGPTKDAAPEAPKTTEAPKDESVAEPSTVAAETAPAEAAVEPPTETPVVDAPEASDAAKKEKRKSFTGFATGLFKTKAVSKEPSPEPTAAKEVAEDTPTAPAVETPAAAPAETPAEPTEETQPAPPTETKEKSKRGSIFMSLLPKKETKDKSTAAAPLTNGDAAPTEEAVATSSEAVFPSAAEEAEVKPPTPKKEGLGRRLTSQFKSLGRSKSPEKSKATKVSDEAPKIDTAIETTPQPPTTSDAPVAEPEVKADEPLVGTTEAPATSAEAPATTDQLSAPAVTTQA